MSKLTLSNIKLTGTLHNRVAWKTKTATLYAQCLLLALVFISMNSIAQDSTLRHPVAGPVSGQIEESGAFSWLGIPYAQAPLGELRWKAPRVHKSFDGPFAANTFSDICTQLGHPLLDIDPSLYGKAVGSEDCLYLNIWSPPAAAKRTTSQHPCRS